MKHFHLFASLLLAVSVATFSTQASTPPRNSLNYSVLDGKTVKGDNKEEVKQSAPGHYAQAPARVEATNSNMNSSPIKLGQNKPKQTLNQIV